MHRTVLKMATRGFVEWMRRHLPPAGVPFLHDFEARAIVLIDTLPASGAPPLPTVELLDVPGLTSAYEWLFAALVSANAGDPWVPFACHMARLHALMSINEILDTIRQLPRPSEKFTVAPGRKSP